MSASVAEIEKAKDGLWPYVLKRSIPAGLVTGSVGLGINRYLVTRFPAAAKRNASARTFMMCGTFIMGFITVTEIYSLKYERWVSLKINNLLDDKDEGVDQSKKVQLPQTVTDKALDYLNENRFKCMHSFFI